MKRREAWHIKKCGVHIRHVAKIRSLLIWCTFNMELKLGVYWSFSATCGKKLIRGTSREISYFQTSRFIQQWRIQIFTKTRHEPSYLEMHYFYYFATIFRTFEDATRQFSLRVVTMIFWWVPDFTRTTSWPTTCHNKAMPQSDFQAMKLSCPLLILLPRVHKFQQDVQFHKC